MVTFGFPEAESTLAQLAKAQTTRLIADLQDHVEGEGTEALFTMMASIYLSAYTQGAVTGWSDPAYARRLLRTAATEAMIETVERAAAQFHNRYPPATLSPELQ